MAANHAKLVAESLVGSALGLMCGDALGAPVEGLARTVMESRLGWVSQMRSGKGFPAGLTTDDAQLMTGLLEALDLDDTLPSGLLARRYAENFEAQRGYGSSTLAALQALRAGKIGPEKLSRPSYGNGGAMGIAPLGVYFHHDLALVCQRAEQACRTTHHHPEALSGAISVALCAAILTRQRQAGPPLDMRGVLVEAFARPPLRDSPMAGPVALLIEQRALEGFSPWQRSAWLAETFGATLRAVESVPVALGALIGAASFNEAVEVAVNSGGDTDTQGAMAGGMAGAFFGVQQIPERWLEVLENGRLGRGYVRKLAERLAEKQAAKLTERLGEQRALGTPDLDG